MKLFEFEQIGGRPCITGLYALVDYAVAYWRAAREMIDNKLFDGRGRPDFSTFPIVYLYRHAMELLLKAILDHHRMYATKPELLLGAKDRGHRLTNDYLTELQWKTQVCSQPEIL